MAKVSRKWILALVLIFALCSACTGKGQDENMRIRAYDDDGVLGTTNSNPNLGTSPTYHNYKEDQKLIRKTLAAFPEVKRPRVMINGATAIIYFNVPENYSWLEQEQLETRVLDALSFMLPRYDIELRPRKS